MAYCPKICDFDKEFEQFCPVELISVMHARGFFLRIHRKLLHDVLTPKSLCEYIRSLAGRGITPVQTALIKTHSLRIGGHTYFTAMGMNPDLTNYLGRRKVKESSLRYFRASARLTLSAYRMFFTTIPPPAPLPWLRNLAPSYAILGTRNQAPWVVNPNLRPPSKFIFWLF